MNFMDLIKSHGQYLCSAPVEVKMAGFTSDTLTLQKSGWQMSIETFERMFMTDGFEIRVAFKHDGLKQMMFGICRIDNERMGRAMFNIPWIIQINYMASDIRFEHRAQMSISSDFTMHAVDCRPEYRKFTSLSEMAIFKPIKSDPDFEIYIHEKDEKEILDILLQKQDSRQKEIRQNIKRRLYQEGNSGYSGNLTQDNVNTDVKHQLVLVS